MVKSKKLKCDEGIKANGGNFCLLVEGKGEDCEKKGCCIGCDEVATCKHPCRVALEEAGIEKGSFENPETPGIKTKKKKKKDKDTDKASQALEAHDIELMQRQSKIEQLEGDYIYDRESCINETIFLLDSSAKAMLEAGKRILLMKEKEEHGLFMNIVSERLSISHRSATRFMTVARKQKKYPKIDFGQAGQSCGRSSVYALLEAPDEILEELNEKGVMADVQLSEIYTMKPKDIVALVDKLKTETDKVVKEEVKGLEAEKKALIKENERLAAFDPEGRDIGWSEEQISAVKTSLDVFNDTARRFVFDERIIEHPELQVKVDGILAEAEASLNLLKENWENFVSED